jgi:hypothetical protein
MEAIGKFPIQTARKFSDVRGDLFVIENYECGVDSKRIFWITNVPGQAIRANHGHLLATQCLTGLLGEISIKIETKYGEKFHRVLKPSEYIVIPPLNLIELKFSSPAATLLVQTDRIYDPAEMFSSFSELEHQL